MSMKISVLPVSLSVRASGDLLDRKMHFVQLVRYNPKQSRGKSGLPEVSAPDSYLQNFHID
jgi:hypothetical protein